MENLKIRVTTEKESKEVQELLSYLDYNGKPYLLTNEKMRKDGYRNDYEIGFLFAELGGNVSCSHKTEAKHFDDHPYKEITLQKLKDLAVLKHNSVDDATHETNVYKFYVSEDSVFEYISGWKDTSEYVEDFNLNPIEKKEMKEFLDTEQGYTLVECFVGETLIPIGLIEVPEGAEILYFDKRYEPSNHFFKTVNGNSYYKYLEDGSKWMEYSNKGLNVFKREY